MDFVIRNEDAPKTLLAEATSKDIAAELRRRNISFLLVVVVPVIEGEPKVESHMDCPPGLLPIISAHIMRQHAKVSTPPKKSPSALLDKLNRMGEGTN